jgi:hypothetical protein
MMRVLLAAIVSGATLLTALSPASAWRCVAGSGNGATGLGSGIILERAQKFAINRCAAAGGNVSGYACSIRHCR